MQLMNDLKSLWPHVSIARRKQLLLLLGLMLMGAFAELVSLGAVVPFITVLANPELALQQPMMRALLNAMGLSEAQLPLLVSLAFAVIVVLASGIRLFLMWANNKFIYGLGHDLSADLYTKTLYRPYSFHVSRNSSEIIGGVNKAMVVINGYLMPLMTAFTACVLALGIVAMLVYVDPFVAMVGSGAFAVSYFVVAVLVRRRTSANGQLIARANDRRVQEIQEGLGGIRDVILDSAQPIYSRRFSQINQGYMQAIGNNNFLGAMPRYAVEAIGLVIIALFAMDAARSEQGITSLLPVLAALGLGAQKLLPLVQQMYQGWSYVLGNRQMLHDVLKLLDCAEPLAEITQPVAFQKDICLAGVSFYYPSAPERAVLNDVSVNIAKGASIGIVGKTGSGKSTMVDLLMGLLSPSQGTMSIDGKALDAQSLPAWQKHISHVPQVIYLSDATIAENIAFGCRREKIDEERLKRAAEAAQIAEYIEQLPDAYDTAVGERGVRLSGGQRQRIGIARALYRQTEVLVLDEATSALDDETEKRVMAGINSYGENITKIIIAHRLSTLSECDACIRLSLGKVIN